MSLEGRTALVTGGVSGIGAATARRLAAEGARVAIGAVNEQGSRAVAGELDGCRGTLEPASHGASYVTGQTLTVSGGPSTW